MFHFNNKPHVSFQTFLSPARLFIHFIFISDDRTYFESQVEDSDSEKLEVAVDTQREMFLQYISNDLTKLIPQKGGRGMSPDVDMGTDLETSTTTDLSNAGQKAAVIEDQEIQVGHRMFSYIAMIKFNLFSCSNMNLACQKF